MRLRRMIVRLAALLVGIAPLVAGAQATDPAPEQANIDAALALTRECATKYEIATSAGKPLKWEPQPVLRWSNPERGQIYGNVFLWTTNGRPEAVGSLFKWYSPHTHMSHEFQSLSTNGIAAKYEGQDAWKATEAGLRFTELPDAPPLAAAAPARLIQMRQAARRFTALSVDREGLRVELRLLPQPVYRYEVTGGENAIDGGLFVFVQGTDPEVWLLIEAQPSPDSKSSRWTYALARMNSIALTASLDGREVWHRDVLPWASIKNHREPYTSFQFERPTP